MGAIATLVTRDVTVKLWLVKWATDDSFWLRRTAMRALVKQAQSHRDDFDQRLDLP